MGFEVFYFDIKPHRVQRKRTKGWKMPPNTIYVGRPSRWGNPYDTVDKYRDYVKDWLDVDPEWLEPLRGKHLACWCDLSVKCHADILLRLANE